MKRFKDLEIRGLSLNLVNEVQEKIILNCSSFPFLYKETSAIGPDTKCSYIEVNDKDLLESTLCLFQDAEKIWVANIVPTFGSDQQFTIDAYNAVLDKFRDDVIIPVLSELKLLGSLWENRADYEMEDIIPKSCDKLKLWASLTPQYTNGFSNPNDLNRWHEFICELIDNNEQQGLSCTDLETWLMEKYQWLQDDAYKAGERLDMDKKLLEYYIEKNKKA